MSKIKTWLSSIDKRRKQLSKKTVGLLDKNPFVSFLGLLGLLLILVIVGNRMRKPSLETSTAVQPIKAVETYQIGSSPKVKLQGKIEKSGVINVMAQSPGIVQKVKVKEGDKVKRGSNLVSLSTNYQGGNVSSVSRQIAQTNVKFLTDNYDAQKDIIGKQREIANTSDTQADKLRDINRQSIDDTKGLISLNEDIVNQLDKQINYLQLINVNGASDSAILQAKQGKAQILAGLNSLKSGLRATEYINNDDKEAASLGNIQKDLTLKQLDLQEKSLDLNKEIAQLNAKLASISESLMFPTSPTNGVVERVFVKPGQMVNPGTPIASIKGDTNETTIIVLVSSEMARSISKTQASLIHINDHEVELLPRYISQEPTEGTLHSVLYLVPAQEAIELANNNSIAIEIPVGVVQASTVMPFIPIDAVYQTENQAFIHLVTDVQNKKTAHVKEVELGPIYGQYVEIAQGLSSGDQVILDRSVIDGEEITIKSE
jgi:multidrug efflux pump subunit AcrA (membrane-fusion protein)